MSPTQEQVILGTAQRHIDQILELALTLSNSNQDQAIKAALSGMFTQAAIDVMEASEEDDEDA